MKTLQHDWLRRFRAAVAEGDRHAAVSRGFDLREFVTRGGQEPAWTRKERRIIMDHDFPISLPELGRS